MSDKILRNRLEGPLEADQVILPGRVRMDLESLSAHYGVPFILGPEEMIDLPQFLGRGAKPPDLSGYDINIFAEIVEAPEVPLEEVIARARTYQAAGADVIDIGCQPDVPFPHLEETVQALKAEGLKVSVDSGDVDELQRGALAGADYVLSLDETSLDAVAGTTCVPVLVPKPHGDLDSLFRAIDKANALGIKHLADPILDPIHFGIIMIMNLCVGLCTPPVGSLLFIGCSVADVKIGEMIKPLLQLFVAMIIVLLIVTYIPQLSLWLPRALGF